MTEVSEFSASGISDDGDALATGCPSDGGGGGSGGGAGSAFGSGSHLFGSYGGGCGGAGAGGGSGSGAGSCYDQSANGGGGGYGSGSSESWRGGLSFAGKGCHDSVRVVIPDRGARRPAPRSLHSARAGATLAERRSALQQASPAMS